MHCRMSQPASPSSLSTNGRRNVANRLSCRLAVLSFVLAACNPPPPASPSATDAPFAEEIARFVESDRVNPPEPCQILFVGSSSIRLWETLSIDMQPLPVINRGFGGSQISDVNFWFETLVTPYRPSAIVFYAGENDIDLGKSPEAVAADFDTFLAHKTRALGETPVYFISLKPSKLRFDQLDRQARVNELIRRKADERDDLHFIDISDVMLDQGRPKDLYVEDGLHMNQEGYALWTEALRAVLLPETEQQARRCQQSFEH